MDHRRNRYLVPWSGTCFLFSSEGFGTSPSPPRLARWPARRGWHIPSPALPCPARLWPKLNFTHLFYQALEMTQYNLSHVGISEKLNPLTTIPLSIRIGPSLPLSRATSI